MKEIKDHQVVENLKLRPPRYESSQYRQKKIHPKFSLVNGI